LRRRDNMCFFFKMLPALRVARLSRGPPRPML
jgi:hypothetical protein